MTSKMAPAMVGRQSVPSAAMHENNVGRPEPHVNIPLGSNPPAAPTSALPTQFSEWNPNAGANLKCDLSLIQRIALLSERKKSGASVNADLARSKHFNNPAILEKLVRFYEIDEIGTNFPPEVWSPSKFLGSASFYDILAKKQEDHYKNLAVSQQARRGIGFVPSAGISVSSHVQRGLMKYENSSNYSLSMSGSAMPSSLPPGSSAKRKQPPSSESSDPKRPKR